MSVRSALQLPKEHGSWGMFFIPTVLGVVAGGRLHSLVWLFLLSASAAFLAREPFMAAWRGWRRRTEARQPTRMTVVYGVIAALAGFPLIGPRPWLVPLAVIGGALYVWHAEAAMKGEGRSLLVEILAISTSMLTAPAAYYTGAGALDSTALLAWLLSLAYFIGTVFYVRMRLTAARAKVATVSARARRACFIYHCSVTVLLMALVYIGTLRSIALIGFAPALARAFFYVARPSATANLKQIGWSEVLLSLVFLVAAAAALTGR